MHILLRCNQVLVGSMFLQLETKYEESIENEILLYLPQMEFLKLVDGFQKVI